MAEKVTLEVIDERIIDLIRMAGKRDIQPEVRSEMEAAVRGLLQLRNKYNISNEEFEKELDIAFPKHPVQEWLKKD